MKMKINEILIKKVFTLVSLCLLLFTHSFGGDVFVLGREDGEGALIYPRHAKEGPDGNVYVYDEQDAFIKVYSPRGIFIRKMGGKGEGPGEIKRSDGVTFGFTTGKRIFFTEFFGGHPWITFMELDGRFYKSLKPNLNNKVFGVEKAVSLPDGGFLIEFAFLGNSEKQKKYFLQSFPRGLFRIDAKGNIVSKIKEANNFSRISFFSMGADLAIPFVPRFEWCPFKNKTIIFSDGTENKLKVLSSGGELISELITSLPENETVTKKDLDEWRNRYYNYFKNRPSDIAWFQKYGKVIDNYKESIYDKKPYIHAVAITPDGNILITGKKNPNENNREFWLIDAEGKTLATISLDAISLNIFKQFIILKEINDEDEELIFCFKRTGNEKEDFLAIKDSNI